MYPRTNIKTATDSQTHAAATATVAAPGDQFRIRLAYLHASVSAGSALLTVSTDDGSGAVTLFQATVTPGGPVNIPFGALGPQGVGKGNISAVLADAGASNVGTVSIGTYLEA